jgi:hypothetical protein
MARVKETHKGHDIIIDEPNPKDDAHQLLVDGRRADEVKEPRVYIDGRPMNIIKHPDGTYSSEGIFYKSYPSLSELARASIDAHLSDE